MFTKSRNSLTLEGATRPQISKRQNTENKRHGQCMETSWPDREHEARQGLRSHHPSFPFLPDPIHYQGPLTRLPAHIGNQSLPSISTAPIWSKSPASLLWAAAIPFQLVSLLLLLPLSYQSLLSSWRDFIHLILSLRTLSCLKPSSGFPLHLE